MCLEECRGDGLWTSLDKPTEKNKTDPMALFISISLFFYTEHKSVPGHTERGGVRHHILFHKLRNPQVAAMRGFSKTCRNAATFLATSCWGLALRAGQAHSNQLAREMVSSLSALLHPWSAPVQLALCGFGVR